MSFNSVIVVLAPLNLTSMREDKLEQKFSTGSTLLLDFFLFANVM